MNQWRTFLTALFAAIVMVVGELPATAAAEITLKTGGSGFGLELMQILVDAYTKSHPEILIVIVPSLGSSGGIKATLGGALDFSISSRPLQEEELRQGGNAREIARTPYVFVVNAKVKINSITTLELGKIYSGQVTSWPDGTPVRLVLRPETESDTAIVKSLSPAMAEAMMLAPSRKGMIVAVTDQDSVRAVERISGTLGGCTLTQILTEQRQVKVLALNGVEPSVKGISDGSYPLAKSLYLVTSTISSPSSANSLHPSDTNCATHSG